MSARRLSQAISEGDGISVLVEVRDAASARRAEEQGAEGLVVRVPGSGLRKATQLPLLAYGATLDAAAAGAADAVVLAGEGESDLLVDLADRAADLGIECVFRVRDEDDLERILEHVDPEIVLLSAEGAGDDQPPLDRLLELLPDIPAGKLAIAELGVASRDEIEQLELAGVDAVLVSAGDVEQLVGDALPEV